MPENQNNLKIHFLSLKHGYFNPSVLQHFFSVPGNKLASLSEIFICEVSEHLCGLLPFWQIPLAQENLLYVFLEVQTIPKRATQPATSSDPKKQDENVMWSIEEDGGLDWDLGSNKPVVHWTYPTASMRFFGQQVCQVRNLQTYHHLFLPLFPSWSLPSQVDFTCSSTHGSKPF